MIRICAWCRFRLGEVAPLDDSTETHGICLPCLKAQEEKYNGRLRSTREEAASVVSRVSDPKDRR